MLRTLFHLKGILLALLIALLGVPLSVRGAGGARDSGVPMTRPEECLGALYGLGNHASWVELRDGSILMVWGGVRDPTYFATSRDGGLTWSKPTEVHDVSGQLLGAHDTSSLIRLGGNAIGYVNRTRMLSGEPEYLRFWRSEDDGKTWQKPIRLGPEVDHEVSCINDGFIRTSSGRIILPVFGRIALPTDPLAPPVQLGAFLHNQWIRVGIDEHDSRFCWTYVLYSDDDGHTWKTSRSNHLVVWDPERMAWHRTLESTVVEVSPGKLLMFLRTDLGRLFQSWSNDNGDTWTLPQPTVLAAPSFEAQLRKIPQTGDLLVVWTQTDQKEQREGLGRGRLSSAISRTQGAVWEFYQNIGSILEGTRVEPGPIQFTRPEGIFYGQGYPTPVRNGKYLANLPDNYEAYSCPSVFFYKDRILISNAYNGQYKEDGTSAYGQIKIVPVSWLYGGSSKNMKPNQFSKQLGKRFSRK